MKKYEIKGISDDSCTCDYCGRTNLKKVVCLEDIENGTLLYLGTTCAAALQKISIKEQSKSEKTFIKQARQIKQAKYDSIMSKCIIPCGLTRMKYGQKVKKECGL